MIRINLQIDEAMSPCLYESLNELPRRQRAERIRLLATLGLRHERKQEGKLGELPEADSTTSTCIADEDIARTLGDDQT